MYQVTVGSFLVKSTYTYDVVHYLKITVIICESYCKYTSKIFDKMDFLSLLIFALLFGVPCFGETAAGVPTPYHCGEFCQHIRAYFVTLFTLFELEPAQFFAIHFQFQTMCIVSIKLLFSYYTLLHDKCH